MVALICAIAYAFVREQQSIKTLDRTDKIACSFITADATVRKRQANNTSRNQIPAENKLIGQVGVLIGEFQTAKNAKALAPIIAYLADQQGWLVAQVSTTNTNVRLTRELAAQGERLAFQLHC